MSKPDVLIIDYGVGNLLSVQRGFEHCGAKVEISSDPDQILKASHVILPGVGAFANAMEALHERNLTEVIHEVVKKGKPFLAICLGMQMLLDESEEFGLTKGLGLISGRVVPIPSTTSNGLSQKIPHIGWSELYPANQSNQWNSKILETLEFEDSVYFVHSFMALPIDNQNRLADTFYGGNRISSVIGRDNVFGCQFHPEKSGQVGLKILSQFIKL
ncbi:imidazole glycerol phosphate synthase subunit HisH [Leptospira biflexa]|uniref:imidazole glycerol phosphate synthase subunit HisH n=1 Tax=Leptospira biflexa TaxID=172 RepID=UPI0010837DCA|nr:imidazole glycerol phosphate synthase subunit HisH [Leptospira biflexa]TGM31714.1 imidazole glycerol phosphate synthase subunit HisH [Leptospira biflexa]TGM39127.1 imidazole glycerol phosphate synthase subunit HisH [Leptospira biflexa]TGM44539.1 imidazole glycerol phosphate synthase subunit HisH [Leptospira biflexa]TGM45420.1 imidazole glycerol phosphate synthase subunit HisH [Leptospira biflexa]TGM53974.1 imidazole glycerol phosphate synthase subunit HisH [Leptospira biflexa]